MLRNTLRRQDEQILQDYRQSMSFLSSELLRSTMGSECRTQPSFRETISFSNRVRSTINYEMVSSMKRSSPGKSSPNKSLNKLKNSLTQLQKKLNKAKIQMSTYQNIICEEEIEEETLAKNEESTNVSSFRKLKADDFKDYHKIKTYHIVDLIESVTEQNQRAYDHLLVSIKVLRNYFKIQSPSFLQLQERKVNLIKDKADFNKKTLLIDIDQTIIHCEEDPSKQYDIELPIQVESGQIAKAYITIRPYAITFLKRMSKLFEIVAFTASHESYADVVLDELDPNRQFIKHRLYRKNCIQIHQNIYAKDLRIINRDLSQMVLVDNAPYSYIFQLQNGIPILPYYNGADNELPKLEKYLQDLSKCNDVRQFNKKTFKLHKYCNFVEPKELVYELYLKNQ